jgi:hypothetical protein
MTFPFFIINAHTEIYFNVCIVLLYTIKLFNTRLDI